MLDLLNGRNGDDSLNKWHWEYILIAQYGDGIFYISRLLDRKTLTHNVAVW